MTISPLERAVADMINQALIEYHRALTREYNLEPKQKEEKRTDFRPEGKTEGNGQREDVSSK